MYIFNAINEMNIWRKVRSVAKENEKKLNEAGFRVDWIGRIYTVINLPEEVISQPFSKEGYILMKLREYDTLFLNMGIADVIAPEIEEIPNADAYLLILSPDRDYIKIKPFVRFIIKTAVVLLIARISYSLISSNWPSIKDLTINTINFIFNL